MAHSGKSISDLIKNLFFYAAISGLGAGIGISAVIIAVDTKLSTNARVTSINDKINKMFPMLVDAYRFNEDDAKSYLLSRIDEVLAPDKVRIEQHFEEKCSIESYPVGDWNLCWGGSGVSVSRMIHHQTALVYELQPQYFVGPLYRVGFTILGIFLLIIYCLLFVAFRSIWKKILGPITVFHHALLNQGETIDEAISDLREIQILKSALLGAKQSAQNEAVVRTISMVFHDVMKPFAVLKGSLSSLGQAKSFDDFINEYPRVVSQVGRATRKAEVLMQEISDYSSTLALDLKPCSVEAIVKESLGEVSDFFNAPNVPVELEWNHHAKILCDEFRLQRVMSNILVNACQASRLKGSVWIRTRQVHDRVYILIGNSGSHVPEESIPKLFQYRFTHGKTRGTGLGLAIAKHIIEAHGGRISVINSVEKNQVEFEFDVAAATVKEGVLANLSGRICDFGSRKETGSVNSHINAKMEGDPAHPVPSPKESADVIKMLVIDDDAEDRLHVRRSIAEHRLHGLFEISECDDPRNLEDLDVISARVFVIDLDLGPIGLDGYQVIERIRKLRGNEVRIFACSNRSDLKSIDDAVKFGANAFMRKPFEVEKLIKLCL